jgi:hypothetical protein
MTEKEFMDEFNACKDQFNKLKEECESETDTSRRIAICKEMVEVVNRMSELDTINKKRLLKEYKSNSRKIMKVFIKSLFKRKCAR